MSKEADKWMNALIKDHNAEFGVEIGIEIVCRMVINDPADHLYIEEVVEKCREHGAADIVKQVRFGKSE